MLGSWAMCLSGTWPPPGKGKGRPDRPPHRRSLQLWLLKPTGVAGEQEESSAGDGAQQGRGEPGDDNHGHAVQEGEGVLVLAPHHCSAANCKGTGCLRCKAASQLPVQKRGGPTGCRALPPWQALDVRCAPESAPAATMDMPMTAPTAAGLTQRAHTSNVPGARRAGRQVMGGDSKADLFYTVRGRVHNHGRHNRAPGLTNGMGGRHGKLQVAAGGSKGGEQINATGPMDPLINVGRQAGSTSPRPVTPPLQTHVATMSQMPVASLRQGTERPGGRRGSS